MEPWEIDHVPGELMCGMVKGSMMIPMSVVEEHDFKSNIIKSWFFLQLCSTIRILSGL